MSDLAPWQLINYLGCLNKDDSAFVSKNIGRIEADWSKRQIYRTKTEILVSVLNDIKHPTNASKYWQCIREQSVFYENLVKLSFDYRRNKIEQKKLVKQLAEEEDALKGELIQIDLEEKQFAQTSMEQVAKDRVRELKIWSEIMRELDNGSFDTKDVNDHQLESYAQRFGRQLQNLGNASLPEIHNLVGQYETTMRHLQEQGIITMTGKKNGIRSSH